MQEGETQVETELRDLGDKSSQSFQDRISRSKELLREKTPLRTHHPVHLRKFLILLIEKKNPAFFFFSFSDFVFLVSKIF